MTYIRCPYPTNTHSHQTSAFWNVKVSEDEPSYKSTRRRDAHHRWSWRTDRQSQSRGNLAKS